MRPLPWHHRHVVRLVAVMIAALLGASVAPAAGRAVDAFAGVDRAMGARVRGQRGGMVLIARDAVTLHRRSFGRVGATTRLPIASASKWLTAATVMTLVDQGRLALDAPVAAVLPEFGGAKDRITLRMLLAHRSGLPEPDCVGDPATTIAECVQVIAQSAPTDSPGRAFHYSNVGFEVAARMIEVATGEPFERAFEERLARPVGLSKTRFDLFGTRHPDAAGGARSTVVDYARFLDMVVHLGVSGQTRVLQLGSVLEIERDQEVGVDTSGDEAVHITRNPTYGLGVWRDLPGPGGVGLVVDGSGSYGFYPWVDRRDGAYGIVAVDDERGAELAVPASQRVARLEWAAAAVAP